MMLNDTINKLTFEFTYQSEAAAKAVGHEIENYKAHLLTSVISEVLSEKMDKNLFWKMDKVEIDLGSIHLEDVGTDYILQQFKKGLAKNLDEAVNYVRNNTGPRITMQPVSKVPFEVVTQILLTGDLPWWVEKDHAGNMDGIFRAALLNNREQFAAFLFEQQHNPDIITRIKTYCVSKTIRELDALIPHPSTYIINRRAIDVANETRQLPIHLNQLIAAVKPDISATVRNLQMSGAASAFKFDFQAALLFIMSLGKLTDFEINGIKQAYRTASLKTELVPHLLKLADSELACLSLMQEQFAENSNTSKEVIPAAKRKILIERLVQLLEFDNPSPNNLLNNYTDNQLI
jgi:hypothetical protein